MAGLLPFDALAQTANQALKQQITGVATNIGTIPKLIAVICYVSGTFMTVRALFALKGFIQAPDDNPVNRFIGYAMIATMLIFLPDAIYITQETINIQDVKDIRSTSGSFTSDSCTEQAGLNRVFCNLVVEISPFSKLIALFAYVLATGLVLSGMLSLKAYGDDPSRTPVKTIIIKFVLATLLISLPLSMNIFISTMTGKKASAQPETVSRPTLFRGDLTGKK